jgi:uncharacterized protein
MSLSLWLISILCAVMIGMSKTGFNGLGTLVVPIMALTFGAMPSSGVVLPMLVMADIFGVAYYHRNANIVALFKVLLWALVGLVIGLLTGKAISAEQFRQLIGWLMILSLFVMLWNEYRKSSIESKAISKWLAFPFGIAGGFSTMIGNAAGPVMSVYLLMKKLPKNEFIGTAAWFFFIINLIKMPMQIWGWHNINSETLLYNLKMLPFIAIGAFLGIKLVKIIPDRVYRWLIIVGTFIASVALIF